MGRGSKSSAWPAGAKVFALNPRPVWFFDSNFGCAWAQPTFFVFDANSAVGSFADWCRGLIRQIEYPPH